jgi:hypothetical protein
MSARPIALIFVIASVAALAFAGGRMSATGQVPATANDVARGESPPLEEPEPSTGATAPPELRDVAYASFDRIYQTLKSASPEMLAVWVKDLEQISPSPRRLAALCSFFKTLMEINPIAARDLFLQLKKENRWVVMREMKDAVPPRAMRQFAEVLLGFKRDEISGCSYDLLREAIGEWSKTDPIATKQFLEEHREAEVARYFPALVRNWAAYDPEAARAWVAGQIESRRALPKVTHPEGEMSSDEWEWQDLRGTMTTSWIEGFLENDREAAVNYLLTTKDADLSDATRSAAGALFIESPDEARAFILHLPAERQAEAIVGVTLQADRFVYGDADDEIRSPEFVTNWMLQFPEELWGERIWQVLREWQYKNAENMWGWIAELPAASQQTVVAEYKPYISGDDADKELESVMNISAPALRDQLLGQVMRQAREVRAEILAALDRTQLPLEQRLYLASLIPPPHEEVAEAPKDDEE